MKTSSMKVLFACLAAAGFLGAVPSALADEEPPPVGVPSRVPEGVSTLAILGLALGGIAVVRRFVK